MLGLIADKVQDLESLRGFARATVHYDPVVLQRITFCGRLSSLQELEETEAEFATRIGVRFKNSRRMESGPGVLEVDHGMENRESAECKGGMVGLRVRAIHVVNMDSAEERASDSSASCGIWMRCIPCATVR